MTVILRLQGLNIQAGPEDIRRFFHGLPIPDGGVHITGGKTGEAFIIFSTERAGQLAMLCSGKQLRGSTVTLHTSSMEELRHKLELRLRKRKVAPAESEPAPRTATGKELCTALLNLVAAVQELQSNNQTTNVPSPPPPPVNTVQSVNKDAIKKSPVADQKPLFINEVTVAEPTKRHVEEQHGGSKQVSSCKPGYLRLYGLPKTITKEEVCQFLAGLGVVDVITETLQGQDQCCLVKMASFKEAEECLKYSDASQRDSLFQVRLAHERMWEYAVEQRENSSCSTFSQQDRFSPDMHKNSSLKRPCSFWGTPKRRRSESPSFETEYCVMVKNLPTCITKTKIRNLFSCPDIPSSKILHLLNKHRERTSTAFIIFTRPEEYTSAMNMNGSVVGSRSIDVSSITKEKMRDMMHQNTFTEPERPQPFSTQTRPALSCIYARNFPANVTIAEVRDFFSMYNICEEDVKLLEDENGNRIGEAVIRFECEKRAREVHSLHRTRFREEQILLTCISPQQMKDILRKTH